MTPPILRPSKNARWKMSLLEVTWADVRECWLNGDTYPEKDGPGTWHQNAKLRILVVTDSYHANERVVVTVRPR